MPVHPTSWPWAPRPSGPQRRALRQTCPHGHPAFRQESEEGRHRPRRDVGVGDARDAQFRPEVPMWTCRSVSEWSADPEGSGASTWPGSGRRRARHRVPGPARRTHLALRGCSARRTPTRSARVVVVASSVREACFVTAPLASERDRGALVVDDESRATGGHHVRRPGWGFARPRLPRPRRSERRPRSWGPAGGGRDRWRVRTSSSRLPEARIVGGESTHRAIRWRWVRSGRTGRPSAARIDSGRVRMCRGATIILGRARQGRILVQASSAARHDAESGSRPSSPRTPPKRNLVRTPRNA